LLPTIQEVFDTFLIHQKAAGRSERKRGLGPKVSDTLADAKKYCKKAFQT